MIPLPAILSLSKRYWHFLALGVLALLLGVQSYRIASLKADIAETARKTAEQYTKAAVKVILKERASTRIAQEEADRHEKTISDLRAAYGRRLQALTGNPAAAMPVLSGPAFQSDEAACGHGFLRIPTGAAVALMLAADENTQQLIGLQAWIRREIENRK